jgi:MoaA/NifB/PqqE/SkfB family radical SAM enzyme
MPSVASAVGSNEGRRALLGPFRHNGGRAWLASNVPAGGDHDEAPFASRLCLYENDVRLTTAHHVHSSIRLGGGGRYSHWRNALYFSASDDSDPNRNGRTYSFDFSLDLNSWERDRLARSTKRWYLHPDGPSYIARGGDKTPPPLTANLGLTNKCNLRCEICGSQKHLDNTGVRRRHMDFATFEEVAETLFPVLSQVELNSQGDPLLHPQIEDILAAIERHRCEVKIQHNGTLLTDRIIELLLRQHGTLMLSLDAVGRKFDDVRQGGVWTKAEPGLTRLLGERDPRRLSVGVYPTWTARTIGEALNVAEWCAEHRVDMVGFHRYVPVQGSSEQAPSEARYRQTCDQLQQWCVDRGDPVRILFEGECLNSTSGGAAKRLRAAALKAAEWIALPLGFESQFVPTKRSQFADSTKASAMLDSSHFMFPTSGSRSGSDPFMTCPAPNEYAEIGLDGQVSACCRSQDVTLGYATSIEQFSDAWFGQNYSRIRHSLRRGESEPYPLPNCQGCVNFYAPSEAGERTAIDYANRRTDDANGLHLDEVDLLPIDVIQKEDGYCHVAIFPLGIRAADFELWEDDRRLGPAECLHDHIRRQGGGRYHIGATSLYFSSSDGSDARRNGRSYALRRSMPAGNAKTQ